MAYGDTTGLTSYATERGFTLEANADELLVLAHDYLEALEFIGEKASDTQSEQWPRKKAYVDGVELDDAVVPQGIIDAEYTIAIAIDQGNGPAAVITPAVKSESVDTISVEYQDGVSNRNFDPMIRLKLRKYVRTSSAATNVINVARA